MKIDWGFLSAVTVFLYGIALGLYFLYLRKRRQVSKQI